MKIMAVAGRSILDSRGVPTVEATVTVDGTTATAAVPSGTSAGKYEAVELRDDDRRWMGKGVSKAVSHVNVELNKALTGKSFTDQAALDTAMIELDGTENKQRLGANAILGVSLAVLKASSGPELWQALDRDARTLPLPLCNVFEGGVHADNPLSFQEFMLVPHGFERFAEALRAATETFHALNELLRSKGLRTNVGQEGGYAPDLENHQAALDVLLQAIEKAGYRPGSEISLALDVAAGELVEGDGYVVDGQPLQTEQLVAEFVSLCQQYPLVSIEDPFGEDDTAGWQRLRQRLAGRAQVVGDDLTVTNPVRIQEAVEQDVISAAILKPNQIGTVTETNQALEALAGRHGIISHRAGETVDTTIADLAVGWGIAQIKTGSLSRGERVAKYNRLLAIEQQLGGRAVYAGPIVAKSWNKHGS